MINVQLRKRCILAVDLGSTNIKAALMDYDGALLTKTSIRTPKIYDHFYVESSAEALYQAFNEAVRGVLSEKYQVGAICISSQMNSLLLLDENNLPLANMIYGIDTRGEGFIESLTELISREEIYKNTSCPVNGIYWPGKLLWIKKYCPEVMSRTRYIMDAKTYLLYCLTGERVIDCASASTTQLYCQKDGQWWQEMLKVLDVPEEMLPEVKKPYELAGMLKKKLANTWSIDTVPVLVGSGDGPAANISTGAVLKGDCCISLGTTAVLRYLTDTSHTPADNFFSQHLDGNLYLQGVRINEGGDSAEEYIRLAGGVEGQTEGCVFKNGVFYPHTPSENGGKMTAVLNGILFQIYNEAQTFIKKEEIKRIFVTGGSTVNKGFMQRISNLFGMPVFILQNGETFAGLTALVLIYEKKASQLYEAISQLSLKQEIFLPENDISLKQEWEIYKNL